METSRIKALLDQIAINSYNDTPTTLTKSEADFIHLLLRDKIKNPDSRPGMVISKHIPYIGDLWKKTKKELRELNGYPAYNGKELTKEELIYQIVFLSNSPGPDKKIFFSYE
jgi:hypothetical protein